MNFMPPVHLNDDLVLIDAEGHNVQRMDDVTFGDAELIRDAINALPKHERLIQAVRNIVSASDVNCGDSLANAISAARDILEGQTDKPIPPDPEGQNDDRASWAAHAIEAFSDITNMRNDGEDDETILGDLLTDLMHWCDRQGIDFDTKLITARVNYAVETRT
jgi:hypothetical protein